MQYPYLLQFAVDNPWVAFALSWPLALVLITVALSTATAITNTIANFITLFNQIIAAFTVLCRGYPPAGSGIRAVQTPEGEQDEEGGR